ncbi:A1 family peptidase [Marinomonas sp. C2222]|uniref:A1 family peptidase n=1 Tax=Marinomonas sargassi TaxID=2984494 RepID=A0ABT2YRL3_9GAMM|nr:pepsin-like aspartic protease [Marinomonas sargassi]MCV2402537.1 A1 family peptidase [Marinomonas sargassi]
MDSRKDKTSNYADGFSTPLTRGKLYNNGASPWSAELGLGTAAQPLKFSFDTGSNFIWVTSSLCGDDSCPHAAGGQFQIEESSTFEWISQDVTSQDFGPWGTMEVETGEDIFSLSSNGYTIESDIFLAKEYKSESFEGLVWDGGIGIPSLYDFSFDASESNALHIPYRMYSHTPSSDQSPSFTFFPDLLKNNIISPSMPYVSFLTDEADGSNEVSFGKLNQDYKDSREYLFLPWDRYSIDSVSYIWTTNLNSAYIGNTQLNFANENQDFLSLDSGASRFKGDPTMMNQALSLVNKNQEDLIIKLGESGSNSTEELVVPASVYMVEIEGGEDKGKVLPQFEAMAGLDNLALVGSVLIDHLYTVYEYEVIQVGSEFELKPKGMWIFNKPNGPKIIQKIQDTPAQIFTN